MNYKLNFKGTNRRVNNKTLETFLDLQNMVSELFPKSENLTNLEYFYVDSDNDEVTMLTDADVKIM